jgi:hypothetical protein
MNLVVNGNFQTGDLTGWNSVFGITVQMNGRPSGPTPYYGADCDSTFGSDMRQNISVTGSTLYYFQVWIYAINTGFAAGPFEVTVIGFASGAYIALNIFPPPYDTWVSYNSTFTTSSIETVVQLRVRGRQNPVRFIADDIWLSPSPVCYKGDTMIRSIDNKTNTVEDVRADEIRPSEKNHFVITTEGSTVPVLKNIKSGPTKRLYEFNPGSISPNIPYKKLHLTSGHRIVDNGHEIKARDHPSGNRIKCDPTYVYSLVLPERKYIYANGQPVVAYGIDEWEAIEDVVNHTEI